ncbi:phosphate ABC transporter substrate-binding protein PstS [Luteipulveratus sp. YIM 133132]|uniref:phosphate ABC transporter substrate-binding protein PstS n=1 Tax=Luteipulveratus flavus TaxID=3031728 RepID=UPI0023B07A0A|nr:phosphate ABC transporter substrate-binding protein PstS [Luteipulveratus sp. YIM 133132]MDE9365517.1 phosphate ABC transporter substrate-binding protein PstS [Luteipulveratus sp. YIM 133132]
MKITRIGRVSAVALVGALALSACGSDDNSTGSGDSTGSTSAGGTGAGAAGGDAGCGTKAITAEGSTAQDNAIQEAISGFESVCADQKVTYNATGSGDGIKKFIAGQVSFAGSDSALKSTDGKTEAQDAAKACGSPAWNIPMVTGPISIAYNLKGVDKLTLTPALLADIFQGKITTWNDPQIVAVNKGVTLPATPIKPFFRSDESGTTENFTKYLKGSAAAKWAAEPAKKWAGKGEGKAKTAGVASAVKGTEGGITYAEWGAAKDNKLGIAQIDNGAGAVELTGESAGKAIAAAKVDGQGNDLKLKLDYATKEAGTYPIVLVTYEIVCSKYKDAQTAKGVKAFLNHFASADAQKKIEEIGYAPLPDEIRSKVSTAINAIQ